MPSLSPIRVTFLLGSGASIPAGMPSTRCITERVLSGEDVMRHTDGNYYFGAPLYSHFGIPDEYVPRVLTFLKRLKVEIDLYYSRSERFTNYEDLYYVASQIRDSESGDYDNPAVQPLIDKILPDIQPLLVSKQNGIEEIAREATNYIHDVVRCLLSKEPCSLDHLSCIRDACQDSILSNIDVFTLNHDTVLERCLSQNGVQFTDGFEEPINNVRYWNPDLYDGSPSKIRLFKLHGSIDWFRLRPDGGDWSSERIGRIPPGEDLGRTVNPQGIMQSPMGRPMFLVGTFNKMLDYGSEIYADLHYQFYHSLRCTQRLIVCGYGFGDKGINTRIVEWIYSASDRNSASDRRIIVVHPTPEELKNASRGAISNKWDEWQSQNILIVFPKRIEQISWQDIRGGL